MSNHIQSYISINRGIDGTRIIFTTSPAVYSFVLYELLRAFFFLLFVKRGLHSVSFKRDGKFLSASCSCNEYLYVWQYIIVSSMPVTLLGLFPVGYALMYGAYYLLPVGIFFLLLGVRDFKIICLLRNFWIGDKVINRDAQ